MKNIPSPSRTVWNYVREYDRIGLDGITLYTFHVYDSRTHYAHKTTVFNNRTGRVVDVHFHMFDEQFPLP